MICENCRINSEIFGPICSICGSEEAYAPRTMEPKIPDSSPSEAPAEIKILTSFEIKKNKARKIARFLWLID